MSRSTTRLAGFLALAATVALPVLALPAMAQTPAAAGKADTTAMPATPAMPAATPGGTTTTTTGNIPVDNLAMTGGDRASKIIGANVMNEQKQTVGTVDDLIVTPNEKVPVAVLSVGGFLGLGTKYVAVPFSDLKMSDHGVLMPGATKESLKTLPEFKYKG